MGNSISNLVNYEKVKEIAREGGNIHGGNIHGGNIHGGILIHIMDETEKTLITGTLSAEKETENINKMLSKNDYETDIIIYGRNNHEYEQLAKKQKQLKSLGFKNVYIYLGGMFEWLLLQDVFGTKLFPTVKKGEILDFKPM
jgi:hypothetical protein